MFTDKEAKQFVKTLLGDVWQNCRIDKLNDFYTKDVIGHLNNELFYFEDIQQRMGNVKNTTTKRHFFIKEALVIDHLIVFKCRQTWLSLSKHICETMLVGIYRIQEEKVKELWLILNGYEHSYIKTNQNMQQFNAYFEKTFQDKQQFLQHLDDISYYYPQYFVKLTAIEKDTLYYYLNGFTAKESAKKLQLSYRTIESHIAIIKEKYDCSNRAELRSKLSTPPSPSY